MTNGNEFAMTTTDIDPIHDLLDAWAAADVSGDVAAMDPLLADDFTAIGPLGFTLSRDDWLHRFENGLDYDSSSVEDRQVRVEGDTAIVTARLAADGTYRGHPVPEAVRATAVLSRATGTWRLVRVHMSFVAGTRGAPPIPGQG
ncbi:nuclear transport factor 2 family protein [Actinomycetospora sp. CA-101289]|uniref:nuclear transport factor 2 family protein n=1 Tax=Actinomycetospora sp. CA-101289 TaxID=3239893 RepID=UPI003D969364